MSDTSVRPIVKSISMAPHQIEERKALEKPLSDAKNEGKVNNLIQRKRSIADFQSENCSPNKK